jgi:hypothetical protein
VALATPYAAAAAAAEPRMNLLLMKLLEEHYVYISFMLAAV